MKNQSLLLLSALIFIGLTANAQTWLWGEQGNSALKADLAGNGIATNKTGNVYAVGGYEDNITFGTTTLISTATQDLFLVKYDQNGNVLWANTTVSSEFGRILGASVATDDSDNAYVTGFDFDFSQGTDTATFGTSTLDLPGYGYLFLVKYNANGTVAWAREPNTSVLPDGSLGEAVATDRLGHEYVTGGNSAPFLIKYDRNGNTVWTVQEKVGASFSAFATGYSVTTDVFGNIYMAGYFTDSLYLGSNKFYSLNQGVFIAKYDSNGNVLWAQQSDNNHYTNYMPSIPVVTADKSGAAYLTGAFSTAITFGTYNFSSPDSDDLFIVKYNPAGSISWAKQSSSVDSVGWDGYSICADDSNHIYVSGGEFPYGTPVINCSLIFDTTTISFTDTFKNDLPVFLLKLDTTGKVLCSSILPAGGAQPTAVTADYTGAFVYMAGRYDESFTIGTDNLTSLTGGHGEYLGRWQACHVCNLSAVINPQPAVVCNGVGIILSVPVTDLNYAWSPSAGLNATTGDSVVANPTITTTYTVTVTDTFGCSVTAIDVVTVGQSPNKPVITISVTGDTLFSSAKNGNEWFFNDTLIHGATDSFYIITGRQPGWYYVEVINQANGCSTTSDSVEAAINQLSAIRDQLSIFPNPANAIINVNISSRLTGLNEWKLQLTDVLGRTLFTRQSLNYYNEIDLSNLPGGVYFITVINKTDRTSVPVVKE